MKILLLGEYSNVHWTLAEGLRALGHEVVVASNGDFWKNYPRDIDLERKPGKLGGIKLLCKILLNLPRLRGFDIVQFINPMFLEIKAERILPIYNYIKKHNRRLVLGAFGMDYYWAYVNTYERPLRYSDFNFGDEIRMNDDAIKERKDWIGTEKERLNKLIADEADAIVTGLYEYDATYRPYFPDKTTFIPFPIKTTPTPPNLPSGEAEKLVVISKASPEGRFGGVGRLPVSIFIGISPSRSEYKGTDIMLRAAEDLQRRYPEKVELRKVSGVPFEEYRRLMLGSDAILDQLYSYTPSMNPLEAMSHGIVCVGGGEPENYDILGEEELRPIINVEPNYESVYAQLEDLILHPERIPQLKQQSIEYIRRHHDYIKVAQRYEILYKKILSSSKKSRYSR